MVAADFETWAMRGLVVVLAGVAGKLIWDRWTRQDNREEAFSQALEAHRKATDEAMKSFRSEMLTYIERLRATNETAFGQFNTTMAQVAKTVGDIRARMAERYATREDLAALEERLEKRFELCAEGCPRRRSTDR